MRLIIIESPLAGNVQRNVAYARAAMADCIARGEAPFASHLLYPQPRVLDDLVPEERAKGIACGFAWAECAHARVIYTDLGTSAGMQAGISHAMSINQPLEYRSLSGWSDCDK